MSTELPARPQHSFSRSNLCIIKSNYNSEYTDKLLSNCMEELNIILPNSNITVLEAPGSFELPVLTELAFQKHNPDGVIVLGLILKGETAHADMIAQSITNSLQEIAVRRVKPVIHEVLLVNDLDQAYARCVGSDLNRGREAARAFQQMLKTFKQ